MSNFIRYEGDSYSKLRQMMSRAGDKPAGVRIELATVVESPPNLKVRRDSDQLILEKDELVVAQHLTRHTRNVSINYEWNESRDLGDSSVTTGSRRNYIVGQPDVTPYHSYDMDYAYLTMQDVLKVGDRVLLACDDDNMVYYVLDRAVFY